MRGTISGSSVNKARRSAFEIGNFDAKTFEIRALDPRFLARDRGSQADVFRVMRLDFRADAVLQRRDDFPARRVIFRIRRKNEHHVQRQAHRIALDLHVALLHDVEKSDLNFPGEIGQLVDGEDSAVRARQKPEVNRQFVAQ
jgi:hypothetical protein